MREQTTTVKGYFSDMTPGQLKVRILQRLKYLHEHNPGIGIIPHPNQSHLYEELFGAELCRVVGRALTIGEIGNLDDPSHRRSFHFIDSHVGYTATQLIEATGRLGPEAKYQRLPVPTIPL